mgnify:CR=1 FL=1
MACKKSELVGAVNSFASARATGDANLQNFSAQYLQQLVDTLEFAPEEVPTEEPSVETED